MIHKSSIIHQDAKVGKNVKIGPYCVIGPHVEIEENVEILARINFTKEIKEVSGSGLVIEAIIENLEIKQKVFTQIESLVDQDCIITSNTSSLSIASIANALKKPERVLGIHFFNPAPLMPLVEIIPAVQTSEDTLIKAKIGGIITAKSFEEGEVISGGAVLFQIIDIKRVEIEVQMAEEDLPMISVGQAVLFTTPSYRDVEFTGKIERISWTADPETGRFPLYVIASNPGLKLRAGMSAKVYLLKKK